MELEGSCLLGSNAFEYRFGVSTLSGCMDLCQSMTGGGDDPFECLAVNYWPGRDQCDVLDSNSSSPGAQLSSPCGEITYVERIR